jgi:DNA-binding GntR family transcriptional regulator
VDKLDPADSRAPYLQVADKLRAQLREERYRTGDKLPPHQAIAQEFGVGVGTIKRAYSLLQDEQLIVTRQGQGSYVRASGDAVPSPLADTGRDEATVTAELEAIRERLDALERHVGLHN